MNGALDYHQEDEVDIIVNNVDSCVFADDAS
jgi:hypothetical protein